MSPGVGADIESLCSKCGDVWHVVVGYPFVLRLMGNGISSPRPIPLHRCT